MERVKKFSIVVSLVLVALLIVPILVDTASPDTVRAGDGDMMCIFHVMPPNPGYILINKNGWENGHEAHQNKDGDRDRVIAEGLNPGDSCPPSPPVQVPTATATAKPPEPPTPTATAKPAEPTKETGNTPVPLPSVTATVICSECTPPEPTVDCICAIATTMWLQYELDAAKATDVAATVEAGQ